jgi:hypothetical protein
MDNRLIFAGACFVAFVTGVMIYLMLPRDIDRPLSDFYMYGRKEMLLWASLALMFGGAFGTVYFVANVSGGAAAAAAPAKVTPTANAGVVRPSNSGF